jgi:hypothetical protein
LVGEWVLDADDLDRRGFSAKALFISGSGRKRNCR